MLPLSRMQSPTLKIKKLTAHAFVPAYATAGSAGMDLTATRIEFLGSGLIKYGTDLAFEIPEGYVGLVFPRSSVYKTGLSLANAVGVIDSDYRGEVTAVFRWGKDIDKIYEVGDRVMQLVLVPIPQVAIIEVQDLSSTARGVGGYGSTGN